MITPYKFQEKLIADTRKKAEAGARSICIVSGTGTGKTIVGGYITAAAEKKKNHVWIVVPRNEILDQFSKSLKKFNVIHKCVKAGGNATTASKVHVWSLATLIRRVKARKIKNSPDIIIFDECHLNLDQQLFIKSQFPDAFFLGTTATPQRLDGRGLGGADGMYDNWVKGPENYWMVENGYLSKVKYFQPKKFDISELKSTDFTGTEIKSEVWDGILKTNQIYGDMIQHYGDLCKGKRMITFCRDRKFAEETAQKFQFAGFKVHNIDGSMTTKKRNGLIQAVKDHDIDGITSCQLVDYGVDIPSVECIIKMALSASKSRDSQRNGRGMRSWECEKTGYVKEYCTILDPVGNYDLHGHPYTPYDWDFRGTKKHGRPKGKSLDVLKLCTCGGYIMNGVCLYCGKTPEPGNRKRTKPYEVIDGRLIEVESKPLPLRDLEPEDRRETQQEIAETVGKYKEKPNDSHISKLLKIAELVEPGNKKKQEKWVYKKLNSLKNAPNRKLWHEIGRCRGYSNGWAYFKCKSFYEAKG